VNAILARAVAGAAVAAALAAAGVWVLTVATFEPQITASVGDDGLVTYTDNRPYCSGGATIPYVLDGVRVEPTMPAHCRGGPIPAGALDPSPVPAVATFVLTGSLGLLVLGFMLSYGSSGQESRRPR
jgi:hypothetical protein